MSVLVCGGLTRLWGGVGIPREEVCLPPFLGYLDKYLGVRFPGGDVSQKGHGTRDTYPHYEQTHTCEVNITFPQLLLRAVIHVPTFAVTCSYWIMSVMITKIPSRMFYRTPVHVQIVTCMACTLIKRSRGDSYLLMNGRARNFYFLLLLRGNIL